MNYYLVGTPLRSKNSLLSFRIFLIKKPRRDVPRLQNKFLIQSKVGESKLHLFQAIKKKKESICIKFDKNIAKYE
eukprot:snap_masked-scaffold_5-processed-gene-15.28-mRNA-1 protein AED:1.00 eAED:1.00 QI:0/0/0/0/1/1/2/0/74